MSVRSKNERIKRKYIQWLREAEGLADSTILGYERAIALYDQFSANQDYASFSQNRATAFKNWLRSRGKNSGDCSITTLYNRIRYVRSFFTWLAGQPGYKSRVKLDAVSYLTLGRKEARKAVALKPVEWPPLEHVKRLADSIDPATEIDRRDRALIAFLLLSGMRDQAVATLPLGCFDRSILTVFQDPKQGVSTKFSKTIVTRLFEFDSDLVSYVTSWAEELATVHGFSPTDPLFPRTKVKQAEGGLTFEVTGVEPVFWKGTNGIRKIVGGRSEAAGLDYYKPHSFRHAASHIAMARCSNAEQVKAVSQNLGHEHVGTTMMTYGTLDDHRVREVVGQMDFAAKPRTDSRTQEMKDAIRTLNRLMESEG
jgi:integrase